MITILILFTLALAFLFLVAMFLISKDLNKAIENSLLSDADIKFYNDLIIKIITDEKITDNNTGSLQGFEKQISETDELS